MSLKHFVVPALAAALMIGPAAAKPQIKDNKEIFSRLLTTAIAHEIRDKCSTIEARTMAATFYVLGILRYAQSQGFSREEIEAYRHTESEQNRLRRATYAYLDKNGVNRAKPETHCPLGEREIQKNSQIGKLIKSVK